MTDLDCSFENDFCKWANDPNNWLVNWATIRREICLRLTGNPKIPKLINEKILTARFWGPVISSDTKLGCVSFAYRMTSVEQTKLTVMRREMGLVRIAKKRLKNV